MQLFKDVEEPEGLGRKLRRRHAKIGICGGRRTSPSADWGVLGRGESDGPCCATSVSEHYKRAGALREENVSENLKVTAATAPSAGHDSGDGSSIR